MANEIQKANPNQGDAIKQIQSVVNATEGQIKAFAKEMGLEVGAIATNDGLLEALNDWMKEQSAIAPTVASKPATKKASTRKSRRSNQPVDFGSAIAHTAQQSAAEIEAFSSTLREGKAQWVEHTANGILDELRSAPEEVVQTVAMLAMEEQADAEFFRGQAKELCAGLFGIS